MASMDPSLRLHYGKEVRTLGALSVAALAVTIPLFFMGALLANYTLLASVVLGATAWWFGWRQIYGMDALRIDPSGRRAAQTGKRLGAIGSLGWLAVLPLMILGASLHPSGTWTDFEVSGDSNHRVVKSGSYGEVQETSYEERLRPDGTWVKDGQFVRYSRSASHRKLEEGSYRDGKRDGKWTFWNDDGSIDTTQSGVYENDVKVSNSLAPAR